MPDSESCCYCKFWAESLDPAEKFGWCMHEWQKRDTAVEGGEEAYRDNSGDLRTLAFHKCNRFEAISQKHEESD
jgi:hypothetical protein